MKKKAPRWPQLLDEVDTVLHQVNNLLDAVEGLIHTVVGYDRSKEPLLSLHRSYGEYIRG